MPDEQLPQLPDCQANLFAEG